MVSKATPQPDPQAFFTTATLCEYLGITRDTYFRWRRSGYGPPAVRFSTHKVYYRRSDVEAWVAEQLEQQEEDHEKPSRAKGRQGSNNEQLAQ